jgi:hypothetical protein
MRTVRHSTKLPRVLSLRHAKNPRHGVVLYGNVLSRSRSTRVVHTVTAAKRGRQFRFRCSCEAASFHPQEKCIHVRSVVRKLRAA